MATSLADCLGLPKGNLKILDDFDMEVSHAPDILQHTRSQVPVGED